MSNLATWFTPSLQTISRSSGRSAVAASAYRACTLIHDERTGITHDFTPKAKNGLVKNICVGIKDNDLKKFWNNAERAENRANSTVARELMLPLPNEWTNEQNEKCVIEIAQMLNAKYHVGVQASIHKAPAGKNKHVHMMFSTREIDEYNYQNGGFGKKTRILDDLKTGEVKKLREAIADIVNLHAQQNGNDWYVYAGKFSDVIKDHIPTHHISISHGKKQKEYIDLNREDVAKAKLELKKLQHQINTIDEKISELTKPHEKQIDAKQAQSDYIDIVNKVKKEMQEAEWEYLEVVNDRGVLIDTMEEIMKRIELGNITDFWEPDTQETLKDKFNSTQQNIDALDERELFLRELLHSNVNKRISPLDYTPPEQVLTNAPSTINAFQFGNDDNHLTNAPSIDDWSM